MKNLKKMLALLLALMMVLSLAACGGAAKEEAPAEEAPAAEEEAPAEETPAEEEAPAEEAPAEEAAPAETYSIGVLQLVQHPALDRATQGFQDKLTELLGDAVTFDVQNAQGDPATCATIANGLVSAQVDLIMANATPALTACMAATSETPILGTSITHYGTVMEIPDEEWTGHTGINVSGTSDLAPLDQQAAMLAELYPVDANPNVGILYCSAEANSKYQATVVSTALTEMGYTVKEYTFADTNDVASVTTTACAENNVLYIPTDNTAASCAETIGGVAIPNGTPIIAGEEGICGGCGVATLTIDYYDLGVATAEMAYEILVNGADVSTMDVEFAPLFTKKYNPTNCETLGLTVPEDYVAIG